MLFFPLQIFQCLKISPVPSERKQFNTGFPGTPKNHFLYWLFQLDDFTLKNGNLFLVVWIFQVFLETCSPKKKCNSLKFSEILQICLSNAPTPDPNHLGRMLCKFGWPPRRGLIPHRGRASGRFHLFRRGGMEDGQLRICFIYCTLPETNSECFHAWRINAWKSWKMKKK